MIKAILRAIRQVKNKEKVLQQRNLEDSEDSQGQSIEEAVFRRMFKEYEDATPGEQRAKAYYIATVIADGADDPKPELLHRFCNHQPPVRKFSDWFLKHHSDGYYVIDKNSGEKGARFVIGGFTRIEPDAWGVIVGVWGRPRYRVEERNGIFVVTERLQLQAEKPVWEII